MLQLTHNCYKPIVNILYFMSTIFDENDFSTRAWVCFSAFMNVPTSHM